MAFIVADRVREVSASIGTGVFNLSGSPIGYQTFSASVGNGNTTYYVISNPGVNEWEVGIGTVGAGTLTRTTILASSNGGTAVNFTAGSKDVFVTYPAEAAVFADNTVTLTNKTFGDNPVFSAGAANAVPYLNGSKVLTTGSALTFDGVNFGVGTTSPQKKFVVSDNGNIGLELSPNDAELGTGRLFAYNRSSSAYVPLMLQGLNVQFYAETSEQMRLTSTGLLINTTSTVAGSKLVVASGDANINGLTVGRGGGAVASNTANGLEALYSNTTGFNNTANGNAALRNNTTGNYNTANGNAALYSNTTGYYNTANGYRALYANTTGYNNTANGNAALYSNTTGYDNTASGINALYSNTTGNFNTANGYRAMYSNTTGYNNTANGMEALVFNTTGNYNTANGYRAMYSNTTGYNNTGVGFQALYNNTTGFNNTANGNAALYSNTTGNYNTANGMEALVFNTTGNYNTANGYRALYSNTTANNNTGVGFQALYNNTTGSGNTAINPSNSAGSYAPVFNPTTENDRFCMGSTGVTNAYIQVAWTVVSDARDKTDFATVPHGLDFVTKLSPTAYRYKMSRDSVEGHGPVRYGFKAQDVLALEGDNPVIVDAEDADKLRFNDQSMLAVLVNAIKELNAKIEAQAAEIKLLKGA